MAICLTCGFSPCLCNTTTAKIAPTPGNWTSGNWYTPPTCAQCGLQNCLCHYQPSMSTTWSFPTPKAEPMAKVTVLPGGRAPSPGTDRSVGYDISASEDTRIGPGQTVLVKTGLIITPPDGMWMMLVARSSLHKKGLIQANGVGIIDPDYCGPDDEIRVPITNTDPELSVTLPAGERIAQIVFMNIVKMSRWERVERDQRTKSRGGFGSTGS